MSHQVDQQFAELSVFSNNPYKYNYRTDSNFPKIIDVRSEDENNDGKIGAGEHYVKAFLMDDSVNKNFWNIPNSAMKKYATGFIGRPLIAHPSGGHPDYFAEGMPNEEKSFVRNVLDFQKKFEVGEIIDVRYEPLRLKSGEVSSNDKAWFAYIRVMKPEFISRIKSGSESFYVSPQVFDIHQNPVPGVTSEFIPLHLAIVKQPAYGEIASIKGVCNGNGLVCMKSLKSAAVELVNQLDNHSSFFENLAKSNYKLSYNQNTQGYDPTFNQSTNVGYDPNSQYNKNQQQQNNPNFVNSKKTEETKDSQGNVLKKIEESKKAQPNADTNSQIPNAAPTASSPSSPQPQTNNNTYQPGTQGNPNPDINTQPPSSYSQSVNPNPNATVNQQAEIPEEVKNAMNVLTEFQKKFQTVDQELEENKKFRQQYNEDKMRKAAEEQRGLIEGYFTEQVIQDPAAREDIINKFVSLPLNDEQMKFVLDLAVSGGFNSAAVDANGKKQVKSVRIKSASVGSNPFDHEYDMIMKSAPTNPNPNYGPNAINSQFRKGFFGEINVENLL